VQYQHITFDLSDGVATLTLARPEVLNALNLPLMSELLDAVARVQADERARALLITGAGRAFSSGADLAEEMPDDIGLPLEALYNPLLERLVSLRVPVAAAVNGAAVGAGCSIALACDFVLAARSAYFLQAFVNIGLVPDAGATWLLPRLVGRPRAQAMMLLGERVSAEQAEHWGLIYKTVEDSELAGAASVLARRLASGPTRTYEFIRQGIHYGLEHSLTQTLRLERFNQREAGRSADFREGVAAFREKRRAKFIGG
jgi:2-(1,2-epoxy-1,2-dihydrophenyl)acetyl-CoA isomerase